MNEISWFICLGCGALWLGLQILWVAGLPRQLRRGEVEHADKGTQKAFMHFWFDQYAWIGISLSLIGIIFIIYGGL